MEVNISVKEKQVVASLPDLVNESCIEDAQSGTIPFIVGFVSGLFIPIIGFGLFACFGSTDYKLNITDFSLSVTSIGVVYRLIWGIVAILSMMALACMWIRVKEKEKEVCLGHKRCMNEQCVDLAKAMLGVLVSSPTDNQEKHIVFSNVSCCQNWACKFDSGSGKGYNAGESTPPLSS